MPITTFLVKYSTLQQRCFYLGLLSDSDQEYLNLNITNLEVDTVIRYLNITNLEVDTVIRYLNITNLEVIYKNQPLSIILYENSIQLEIPVSGFAALWLGYNQEHY